MRKQSNRKSNWSILYHYFITYFVVLFIPLIICCSYYINMISAISKDDIQVRKMELRHAADLIDTMMEEFSYLGDSLTGNIEVNSFRHIESPLDYPKSYRVNKLQQSLPNLYQINQALFDYYIFFDKSEMVINKQIAYKYTDFYELYLREKNSNTYEEWYQELKTGQLTYGLHTSDIWLYKNEEEKEMLVYVRPLFYNMDESDASAVVFFIEKEKIAAMMPIVTEADVQYITDLNGNVLYYQSGRAEAEMEKGSIWKDVKAAFMSKSSQKNLESESIQDVFVEIDGEKCFAVRCISPQTGLVYYTLQSEKAVNQRMIFNTIMVTACVALAVAVGMVLSYYMSLKSATPINDILREISNTTEHRKGSQVFFPSLETTFKYLANSNHNLIEAMEKQKPYIKNSFINRLIFENFIPQDEAEKLAVWVGMEYKDRVFGAIIFQFCIDEADSGSEDYVFINSCTLSLMEVINLVIPDGLCTNIGDEQVVLLINMPSVEKENFRDLAEAKIRKVKEELPANIRERMFIYGGSLVEKLVDIHESYNSAVGVFQMEKNQLGNAVIWYVGNNGNIPEYPSSDLGMKLTYYVMAGDEKGLHDELGGIMDTYIIQNNLPAYLQHMLLNELQIVLFRLLGRLDIGEAEYQFYYDKLEESHNSALVMQFASTLNLYRDVCRHVANLKKTMVLEDMIPSIVSYIDANFGDSDLSLTSVANLFQISEPYLSTVFKQSMETNFSSYVENVRINRAKEFLSTTTMPISEIAEKVGYYSASSFGRAFKRVTGISASEYRSM